MQTINITAQTENNDQIKALKAFLKALKIKFELTKKEPYNPEFVAKIHKSEQEYKNGNFITVEPKDLEKFLGLDEL